MQSRHPLRIVIKPLRRQHRLPVRRPERLRLRSVTRGIESPMVVVQLEGRSTTCRGTTPAHPPAHGSIPSIPHPANPFTPRIPTAAPPGTPHSRPPPPSCVRAGLKPAASVPIRGKPVLPPLSEPPSLLFHDVPASIPSTLEPPSRDLKVGRSGRNCSSDETFSTTCYLPTSYSRQSGTCAFISALNSFP